MNRDEASSNADAGDLRALAPDVMIGDEELFEDEWELGLPHNIGWGTSVTEAASLILAGNMSPTWQGLEL